MLDTSHEPLWEGRFSNPLDNEETEYWGVPLLTMSRFYLMNI